MTDIDPGILETIQNCSFNPLQNNLFAHAIVTTFFGSVGFWNYEDGRFADWAITKVYVFRTPKNELMFQVYWESAEAVSQEFGFFTKRLPADDGTEVICFNDYTGEVEREVGLLYDDWLEEIMDRRISEFQNHFNNVSWFWPINLRRYGYDLTEAHADTPFRMVKSWLYHGGLYPYDYVNYIGEGYVMAYLHFPESQGMRLVSLWEMSQGHIFINEDLWFWWFMGRFYYEEGGLPDPGFVSWYTSITLGTI